MRISASAFAVMIGIVAAVGTLATGCVDPAFVACGDLECPAGATCVGGSICASTDQINACAGLADSATCSVSGATGVCMTGVCVENVCGDGVATGNEVCDGSDVPVTCADLGYYTGAPTCTIGCSIDRSGCSGRCGDGIVQANEGELCDGAQPANTCTDFGRDFGELGCDRFCGPDIVSDCGEYNWSLLLPTQQAGNLVLDGAAVNSHGAIALDPMHVRLTWDRVVTELDNPGWTSADADTSIMIAVGSQSMGWYDGTAWHDLAVGTTDPFALYAGKLATLASDCTFATIDLTSGVATSLPSPGSACAAPVEASGDLCTLADRAVACWNGSAWLRPAVATDAYEIMRGKLGELFVVHPSSYDEIDIATLTVVANPDIPPFGEEDGIIIDGDGNAMQLIDLDTGYVAELSAHGTMIGFSQPNEQRIRGNSTFIQSPEGFIYDWQSGVSRLSAVSGGAELTPSPSSVARLSVLADGAISVCGDQVGTFGLIADGNFTTTSFGTDAATAGHHCDSIAGDPRGAHEVLSFGELYRFDVGTQTYAADGGGEVVTGATGDIWAIVSSSTLQHDAGSGWVAVDPPAGCDLQTVGGGGGVPLTLVGLCAIPDLTATIFQRSGSAWTTLATVPDGVDLLEVAPDGTIFIANVDGTSRLDGATLTLLDPQEAGNITGVGSNDVYLDLQDGVFEHFTQGQRSTFHMPSGHLAVSPSMLYAWDGGSVVAVTRLPKLLTTSGF